MLTKNPFIEPCLPTLTREPPAGAAWVHEVKFDGYRIQIHKDGKHVALYSKNGNDFSSRFPTLLTAVAALPTKCVILDGEVTASKDDGSPDFTALLRRRDAPLCLWVFDILAQNGTDLREQTLSQRRQKLNKLMVRTKSQVIRTSEIFFDATGLLRACSERKMEGIVSKRVDMPYRSGPAKHWLKTKCPAWREANHWRHEFFQKQG